MSRIILFLLAFPLTLFSQTVIKEGVPKDLDQEKIIFLKHEEIEITADKKGKKADKYLYLRQSNHNNVIKEANDKLKVAALEYPFKYALSTKSKYESLLGAGYKYVFTSNVYSNDHLMGQPAEDELIVFEYFILDVKEDVAFKVFEMDEMKVYDSKLMMRKLNKEVRKAYPEAFN